MPVYFGRRLGDNSIRNLQKAQGEQMADKCKEKCICCKELKDPSEFCNPNLSALYCAHFEIPISNDPKNKECQSVLLCRRCLRVLAQKETKKRHYELPKYKISRNLANSIRQSLRTGKRGSWEGLVGYSLRELREHLERRFQEGMSWENYGEWHIDHVLPIASFDFSTTEDKNFKRCWALSNLQPLWAKDNWAKKKA